MKHDTNVIFEGEGIQQSAQILCSCGYKSPKVYAYANHYWTNQHKFVVDHLNDVKRKENALAHYTAM